MSEIGEGATHRQFKVPERLAYLGRGKGTEAGAADLRVALPHSTESNGDACSQESDSDGHLIDCVA